MGREVSPLLGLERTVVRLVPYQPAWRECFEEEARRLRAALGGHMIAIEHVGSTAIEGMGAKPVLDIVVAVGSIADAAIFEQPLAPLGYEGGRDPEAPERLYFVKRTPDGRSTHHLNLTEMGSECWVSHVRFRDYLRSHPEARAEYQELKAELARKFADQRRAYTDGKAEFIKRILNLGRSEEPPG